MVHCVKRRGEVEDNVYRWERQGSGSMEWLIHHEKSCLSRVCGREAGLLRVKQIVV